MLWYHTYSMYVHILYSTYFILLCAGYLPAMYSLHQILHHQHLDSDKECSISHILVTSKPIMYHHLPSLRHLTPSIASIIYTFCTMLRMAMKCFTWWLTHHLPSLRHSHNHIIIFFFVRNPLGTSDKTRQAHPRVKWLHGTRQLGDPKQPNDKLKDLVQQLKWILHFTMGSPQAFDYRK